MWGSWVAIFTSDLNKSCIKSDGFDGAYPERSRKAVIERSQNHNRQPFNH